MLTDARITAIVPTTDLARAVTLYGETLGLTDSGASAPGPRMIYRFLRSTSPSETQGCSAAACFAKDSYSVHRSPHDRLRRSSPSLAVAGVA
jgi:hypothetical protein